jgi:hypothetical protein
MAASYGSPRPVDLVLMKVTRQPTREQSEAVNKIAMGCERDRLAADPVMLVATVSPSEPLKGTDALVLGSIVPLNRGLTFSHAWLSAS